MTDIPVSTQEQPVEQEAVVQLAPDSVPFKNTTLGKTIRTFFQGVAGVLTVALPLLATSEEFRAVINAHPQYAWILIVLPIASAAWTAVQNGLDKTVKNY